MTSHAVRLAVRGPLALVLAATLVGGSSAAAFAAPAPRHSVTCALAPGATTGTWSHVGFPGITRIDVSWLSSAGLTAIQLLFYDPPARKGTFAMATPFSDPTTVTVTWRGVGNTVEWQMTQACTEPVP